MGRAPQVQRIESADDIARLTFDDGVAAVMVPGRLLGDIEFKNDRRGVSPRLRALRRAIRRDGYRPVQPIVARVGQKGKWVVIDGGHRLTAARQVMREWWTNLFGRKVGDLYFLLFTGPRSWAKLRQAAPRLPAEPPAAAQEDEALPPTPDARYRAPAF